jgi:hypothetical protein
LSDSPEEQASRGGSGRVRWRRGLTAFLWGFGVFVAWYYLDGAVSDALSGLSLGLPAALGLVAASALVAAGLVVLLRRFASAPPSIWLGFLAWAVGASVEGLLYVFWIVPGSSQIAAQLGVVRAALLGFEPTTQRLALFLAWGVFRVAVVVVAARVATGLDISTKVTGAQRTSAST